MVTKLTETRGSKFYTIVSLGQRTAARKCDQQAIFNIKPPLENIEQILRNAKASAGRTSATSRSSESLG